MDDRAWTEKDGKESNIAESKKDHEFVESNGGPRLVGIRLTKEIKKASLTLKTDAAQSPYSLRLYLLY